MPKITAISLQEAKDYFEKHTAFRGTFNVAIAVAEGGVVKGVIAATFNGETFKKEHISTDGSAFLGSLLYGALVRNAMAAGYTALHFE